MTDFKKYTVAWISALPIEGAAGELFFDEDHAGPESQPEGDSNNYSLGRIGPHNVVLVTMPKRRPGVEVAAVTARNLARTFPNVRFSLLVGIGGGVPSQHDIRLGDIVVSSHDKDKGGIVQYARGKSIQDQEFEDTSHMNSPPELLLNAVAALEKRYLKKGHMIVEDMETALENVKKKRPFRRPQGGTDRLFEGSYIHPVSNDSCSECDERHEIPRPPRDEEDNDPEIHYGLIGSSSILRKNAIERDIIAKRDGIMCFEMEAAGLMNHFPCLVIRGISDYCDTHKNHDWQGYAAMTAAAYAKALLSIIPPAQVERQATVEVIIRDELSKLNNKMDDVTTQVGKVSQHSQDRETMEILDWLTPLNYGKQQSDIFSQRTEGTGTWLLESTEYQQWLETPGETLFCPGIPGAGKTVLTSIVVDDLLTRYPPSNTQTAVAYIYCNFKRTEEQNLDHLFRSILRQLGQKHVALPTYIRKLYDRHLRNRTQPTVYELVSCIEMIAKEVAQIFLVVDALDECPLSNGRRNDFLAKIRQIQETTKVNFFATSRHHLDILEQFSKSLALEIRAQDSDIQSFLRLGLSKQVAVTRGRPDLQEDLVRQLTKATDGMFLLAQLHLQSLIGKTNVKSVRLAVQQLSQPIGENKYKHAYKETMDRIEGQHPDQSACAKKVLMWIACARRPLTTSELQVAMSMELQTSSLDIDAFTPIEIMISVCAGLVIVNTNSDIIQLVHYTTQDYLEETQNHWFPHAQQDITLACTTYLSFETFGSSFIDERVNPQKRSNEHPFFSYAARNWGPHARAAGEPMGVDVFLRLPAQVAVATAMLSVNNRSELDSGVTALHLAAHFGLAATINRLILADDSFDVNAKDCEHRTPLSWAIRAEEMVVIKQLLALENLDVNCNDLYSVTPLESAVLKRHHNMVKLLLARKDINVNSVNGAPLRCAASWGHKAILKSLLNAPGVDLCASSSLGFAPLHVAVSQGHLGIVKLLLAVPGANANVETNDKKTPFLLALERNKKEVVEYLLTVQEVTTYVQDALGNTTLHYAAVNGFMSVVKLLTTQEVDINIRGFHGETPLGKAAWAGDVAMIELLLSIRGIDINGKNDDGHTALSKAAINGHAPIVRRLLSVADVEVNVTDKFSQTPLIHAAGRGKLSVVQELLGVPNIDINVRGCFGMTALMWAAKNIHKDIVQLLLTYKAKGESRTRVQELD